MRISMFGDIRQDLLNVLRNNKPLVKKFSRWAFANGLVNRSPPGLGGGMLQGAWSSFNVPGVADFVLGFLGTMSNVRNGNYTGQGLLPAEVAEFINVHEEPDTRGQGVWQGDRKCRVPDPDVGYPPGQVYCDRSQSGDGSMIDQECLTWYNANVGRPCSPATLSVNGINFAVAERVANDDASVISALQASIPSSLLTPEGTPLHNVYDTYADAVTDPDDLPASAGILPAVIGAGVGYAVRQGWGALVGAAVGFLFGGRARASIYLPKVEASRWAIAWAQAEAADLAARAALQDAQTAEAIARQAAEQARQAARAVERSAESLWAKAKQASDAADVAWNRAYRAQEKAEVTAAAAPAVAPTPAFYPAAAPTVFQPLHKAEPAPAFAPAQRMLKIAR